jgi:hypothetical protein
VSVVGRLLFGSHACQTFLRCIDRSHRQAFDGNWSLLYPDAMARHEVSMLKVTELPKLLEAVHEDQIKCVMYVKCSPIAPGFCLEDY